MLFRSERFPEQTGSRKPVQRQWPAGVGDTAKGSTVLSLSSSRAGRRLDHNADLEPCSWRGVWLSMTSYPQLGSPQSISSQFNRPRFPIVHEGYGLGSSFGLIERKPLEFYLVLRGCFHLNQHEAKLLVTVGAQLVLRTGKLRLPRFSAARSRLFPSQGNTIETARFVYETLVPALDYAGTEDCFDLC